MEVTTEVSSLYDFTPWAGAVQIKEEIIQAGKADEAWQYLEELYPEGATDTQVNDTLWFDWENIYNAIGMQGAQNDED